MIRLVRRILKRFRQVYQRGISFLFGFGQLCCDQISRIRNCQLCDLTQIAFHFV